MPALAEGAALGSGRGFVTAVTDGSISFTKHSLSAATGETFSSVTIGPDNKLYATTLNGEIIRFNISGTGTLSGKQTINTTWDGVARKYMVYIPASYTGSTPVPLMLVIHGAHNTPAMAEAGRK